MAWSMLHAEDPWITTRRSAKFDLCTPVLGFRLNRLLCKCNGRFEVVTWNLFTCVSTLLIPTCLRVIFRIQIFSFVINWHYVLVSKSVSWGGGRLTRPILLFCSYTNETWLLLRKGKDSLCAHVSIRMWQSSIKKNSRTTSLIPIQMHVCRMQE